MKFKSISLIAPLIFLLMSFILVGNYPKVGVNPMGMSKHDITNITIDTTTNTIYGTTHERDDDDQTTVMKWVGNKWATVGEILDYPVRSLYFFEGKLYVGICSTRFLPVMSNRGSSVYVLEDDKWEKVGDDLPGELGKLIVFNGEFYAAGNFIVNLDRDQYSILRRLKNGKWIDCKAIPASSHPLVSATGVRAVCIYNNKLILAGGVYVQTSNGEADGLVMWDGKNWSSANFPFTLSGVCALAVFNNELIVGGYFACTKKPYKSINGIFSWDGTVVKSLDQGLLPGVSSIAVLNDKMYVLGSFDYISKERSSGVAMWDGKLWSPVIEKFGGEKGFLLFYDMAAVGDKLVVTGFFSTINDVKVDGAASLRIEQ